MSRFFGIQAHPNKTYDVEVPEGSELNITGACVECDETALGSLHLSVDGKDFIIASFGGERLMCSLDLVLCHGQEISFSIRGARSVHVTGYFSENMEGFMSEEQARAEFAECFDTEEGEALDDLKAALEDLRKGGTSSKAEESATNEEKSSKKRKAESDEKPSKKDKKAKKQKKS